MKQKEIPLTKINIQKIVHFLKEVGVPLRYKFEPYIYGPYSSELKIELEDLVLWDDLELKGNSYQLTNNIQLNNEIGDIDTVSDKLDAFSKAVANDFSFDSMEITGTVIYCHQALKNVGLKADELTVLNEFKNWKGSRYSDDAIKKAYTQVTPLLN